MSSDCVIEVAHLSKTYRLGVVGSRTLREDVQRWWHRACGRPDPLARVGQEGLVASHRSSTTDGRYVRALRDINVTVKRGELLGLIGRNGAGKSTLLKILSRVTAPSEGEVRIRGRIASLLEVGTGFHPELTGRDNVYLNGAILGMTRAEIRRKFDEIVAFAEVNEFIDTPVKRYSSGMYVRLAFAVAAHLDPDILIVDEVLAVGDMAFQQKCLGRMGDVAQGGRTVIFVSHNMTAIAQLTQRCLVFEHGALAYDGSTSEAIGHYLASRSSLAGTGRVPVSSVDCQAQWVGSAALRVAELGIQLNRDETIPVNGGITLEVLVDAQTAKDKLRFGYSINDELQSSILTGFTPDFAVPGPGRHLYAVHLDRLPLGPGSYGLSLSLGTGGLHAPKHEFHSIIGFGRFRVAPMTTDACPVGDWHRNWGHVVHTGSSVTPCGGAAGGAG